ncbi:MAG: TrkH family potassium uptake protein [Proteobacteria bacterium]|jgi:trk system potassium uptake protein TrkH|nr:TrkH family potassium uptake protein [Pseudomonadota bacterium]
MGALAVVALVGRIVVAFALLMLLPLAFAFAGHDAARDAFATGLGVTLTAGLAMSLGARRFRRELQPRDGFLLVGLTWVSLPLFGALPLWLAVPGMSYTQACFEAVSGLTATGATVIGGLDALPASLNVWRCFMMWVGGLGIIVLAVAVLPLLGVGGAQLFKTEMTGPMKDQKLTPRIADTARAIWSTYVLLSLACMIAYHAAGMSWLDAFMHMNATVALGGFSSHDASFGYWNSPAIEGVAVVFMLLAGVNLTLYYAAWRRWSLAPLLRNPEAQAFVGVLVAATLLVAGYLVALGTVADWGAALRQAAFHVVSVATTTGFSTHDYAQWPLFAPFLMIMLGCFATCAGSTGGGVKMIRVLLLFKQARREMVRIVHPNVVNPVVLGGRVVGERVMQNVTSFMMMYGAAMLGLTMVLLFSGLDPVTAFSAVVACLNNIGPGLGEVGPAVNYGGLSGFQTWVCTAAMLLGRLELLTVLVLFTPRFWRR